MSGYCSDGADGRAGAAAVGSTWWRRHVHAIVMSALAVIAGAVTGFWPVTVMALGAEWFHQHDHAVKHHGGDWRCSIWLFWSASGATLAGLFWSIQVGPESAPFLGMLYLVGQFLVSACWHRNAPGHLPFFRKQLLGSRYVAVIGLALMATSIILLA